MLAAFPLTTAREKRWWSHCHSLGSLDISTSFFATATVQGSSEKWQWTCHAYQWFRLQLVESSTSTSKVANGTSV